jgi:hypothetical protein
VNAAADLTVIGRVQGSQSATVIRGDNMSINEQTVRSLIISKSNKDGTIMYSIMGTLHLPSPSAAKGKSSMTAQRAIALEAGNLPATRPDSFTKAAATGAELGVSRNHNAVTPRNNTPLPSEYRSGKRLGPKAITERSMTMLQTLTIVAGILAATFPSSQLKLSQ